MQGTNWRASGRMVFAEQAAQERGAYALCHHIHFCYDFKCLAKAPVITFVCVSVPNLCFF